MLFLVVEDNSQLFQMKDRFHLYEDPEEAFNFARNRGFNSPVCPNADALKRLLKEKNQSISGGTNMSMLTIFSCEPEPKLNPEYSPVSDL